MVTVYLRFQQAVTGFLHALGLDRHPLVVQTRNDATREGCLPCLGRILAVLLKAGATLLVVAALALALLAAGVQPSRMPVELFWWPQAASLGGAGFPPAAPLASAVLLGHCPNGRPSWPSSSSPSSSSSSVSSSPFSSSFSSFSSSFSSLSASPDAVARAPRWVLQDLPCLNASHLDAGVCVAEAPDARGLGLAGGSRDAPATMRCLPSFLVVGAQKAGSTDLRGLLSFHPYLDGPSSEVGGDPDSYASATRATLAHHACASRVVRRMKKISYVAPPPSVNALVTPLPLPLALCSLAPRAHAYFLSFRAG